MGLGKYYYNKRFLWSHKTLYTTFFFSIYAVVLLKTCKHILRRKTGEVTLYSILKCLLNRNM